MCGFLRANRLDVSSPRVYPKRTSVLRPRIRIRLFHKDRFLDLLALVDSGADDSMFPLKVAEALDLPRRTGSRKRKRLARLGTRLGGRAIPALLQSALSAGIEVRIWYVGLSSPELHIARVRARVAKDGRYVPELGIRDRYGPPRVPELGPFDNSHETDPAPGAIGFRQIVAFVQSRDTKEFHYLWLCDEHAKPHLVEWPSA